MDKEKQNQNPKFAFRPGQLTRCPWRRVCGSINCLFETSTISSSSTVFKHLWERLKYILHIAIIIEAHMIHLSTEKNTTTFLTGCTWGMYGMEVETFGWNVSSVHKRESKSMEKSSHASFGWQGKECKSCWISDIRPRSWLLIAVATQSTRHCRDRLIHSESLTSYRSTNSSKVFFFFCGRNRLYFGYKQHRYT